ncbi:trypsin-like peptidase domain-containing protein [Nocardiopsis dassonvillei]
MPLRPSRIIGTIIAISLFTSLQSGTAFADERRTVDEFTSQAQAAAQDPRSRIVSNDPNYEAPSLSAEASAGQPFIEGNPGSGPPGDVTVHGAEPYDPDQNIAPPEDVEVAPFEIIGEDERERVTATSYPRRSVVLIRYTDGGNCTGWMYGADTVITAGHCVHDEGAWVNPADITIIPAYDARLPDPAPFGQCGATRLFAQTGWTQLGSQLWDFGGIKLDCNVGEATGWLGAFWTERSLSGQETTITQYPGDKNDQMWEAQGTISHLPLEYYTFYHDADTTGGSSGSPVYTYYPEESDLCTGYCASAVHAGYVEREQGVINQATRITPERFNIMLELANLG